MRDALADASGLFMTAVSQHALFLVLSYLFGFVVVVIILKISKSLLSYSQGGTVISESGLKYGLKFFIIMLLSALFIRGGVTGMPQNVISAFKIGDAQQAIVAMNGPTAWFMAYYIVQKRSVVSM